MEMEVQIKFLNVKKREVGLNNENKSWVMKMFTVFSQIEYINYRLRCRNNLWSDVGSFTIQKLLKTNTL